MKRKAFTVMELLVTMVIMGTLSATVLPRVGGAREETKKTMSSVDKSRELASYVGFDGYTFSSDSAWGGAAWDWFVCTKNWVFPHWTDITVCRDWNSITIQNKNVWATTTWAWPSAPDTSYWNYYQRWNNYWFPYTWAVTTSSNKVNANAYWPWNYYSSSTFIIATHAPRIWDNSYNRNLWWWWNDSASNHWGLDTIESTKLERRWPCDEWYHVPSQWEWHALIDMWGGSSVNWFIFTPRISQFYTDFQIPFAGIRLIDDGSLVLQSDSANLWSSSPSSPSLGNEYATFFLISEFEGGKAYMDHNPGYGHSVRCFKN